MNVKLDEGLKALLEAGKEKKYLTFTQLNDYLPDDAGANSEKLEQLLRVGEEKGTELIEEPGAEERETGPAGSVGAEEDIRADLELAFAEEEEYSQRIDDPVRMYLT